MYIHALHAHMESQGSFHRFSLSLFFFWLNFFFFLFLERLIFGTAISWFLAPLRKRKWTTVLRSRSRWRKKFPVYERHEKHDGKLNTAKTRFSVFPNKKKNRFLLALFLSTRQRGVDWLKKLIFTESQTGYTQQGNLHSVVHNLRNFKWYNVQILQS